MSSVSTMVTGNVGHSVAVSMTFYTILATLQIISFEELYNYMYKSCEILSNMCGCSIKVF